MRTGRSARVSGSHKHQDRSQNGESNVVLVAGQFELIAHPVDGSIGYVDLVQEREEEQQREDGNDPDIDLPDQRRTTNARVDLLGGEHSIAGLSGLSVSRGSWS